MDNSRAKKIKKRFNGGFAIYYGMGSALTTVGTVVTLISRLYQILSGKAELN